MLLSEEQIAKIIRENTRFDGGFIEPDNTDELATQIIQFLASTPDEALLLSDEEINLLKEPCLEDKPCPFNIADLPSNPEEDIDHECILCNQQTVAKAQLAKVLAIQKAKASVSDEALREWLQDYFWAPCDGDKCLVDIDCADCMANEVLAKVSAVYEARLVKHIEDDLKHTDALIEQNQKDVELAKQAGFVEGQTDSGHQEAIKKAIRAGILEGRQEVIEWIEAKLFRHAENSEFEQVWQTQKKVWGVVTTKCPLCGELSPNGEAHQWCANQEQAKADRVVKDA